METRVQQALTELVASVHTEMNEVADWLEQSAERLETLAETMGHERDVREASRATAMLCRGKAADLRGAAAKFADRMTPSSPSEQQDVLPMERSA